jgi:hypothetical protein
MVTNRIGLQPLSDTRLSLAVRAHGAVTALLGVGLGAGILPRSASLQLAAITAPLVVAHQPFTSRGDERIAKTQRFVRALGYVGAALIAGVDLEGKPGVSWRIDQARKQTAKAVKSAA